MTPPSSRSGCAAPVTWFLGSFILGVASLSDPSMFIITLLALFVSAFCPFWAFHRLATSPAMDRFTHEVEINRHMARQDAWEEARRRRQQRGR